MPTVGEKMEQNDFISGCMKVENSVASIYSDLMHIFPENKEFWESMRNDERDHIAFLSDVKSLGLLNEIEKMDVKLSIMIIDKTIKLAKNVNDDITIGSISLKDALAMTLKLEESMVETYTNKLIAKLLSCEDETSLEKLVADEKAHADKIRNMMESLP